MMVNKTVNRTDLENKQFEVKPHVVFTISVFAPSCLSQHSRIVIKRLTTVI